MMPMPILVVQRWTGCSPAGIWKRSLAGLPSLLGFEPEGQQSVRYTRALPSVFSGTCRTSKRDDMAQIGIAPMVD